jgi:hypothetical protein
MFPAMWSATSAPLISNACRDLAVAARGELPGLASLVVLAFLLERVV